MIAAELMTKTVITAAPNTSVPEAARMMLANRISALPVTGPEGELVGIVSEGDLIRRSEIGTERRRPWWLQSLADKSELARDFIEAHALHVRDVMTRDVVAVGEQAQLGEVIGLMDSHDVKRVPVIAGAKLAGIISRSDILRAVAAIGLPAHEPQPTDQALRERVLSSLKSQAWWRGREADVIVENGTVHLWGQAKTQAEKDAVRVAAECTPGVGAIKTHIAIPKEVEHLTTSAGSGPDPYRHAD